MKSDLLYPTASNHFRARVPFKNLSRQMRPKRSVDTASSILFSEYEVLETLAVTLSVKNQVSGCNGQIEPCKENLSASE